MVSAEIAVLLLIAIASLDWRNPWAMDNPVFSDPPPVSDWPWIALIIAIMMPLLSAWFFMQVFQWLDRARLRRLLTLKPTSRRPVAIVFSLLILAAGIVDFTKGYRQITTDTASRIYSLLINHQRTGLDGLERDHKMEDCFDLLAQSNSASLYRIKAVDDQ